MFGSYRRTCTGLFCQLDGVFGCTDFGGFSKEVVVDVTTDVLGDACQRYCGPSGFCAYECPATLSDNRQQNRSSFFINSYLGLKYKKN